MRKLIFPKNYRPQLDLIQTEKAIKSIKDFFELSLASELNLRRVTAPLFVLRGTGVNDDLNGVEKPVSFGVKDMNGTVAEVVQSLAKWKRMMLADYGIPVEYGIYTDMNAVRPDEDLGNLHSLYVDQWDWERVVSREQRTVAFLKYVVRKIYSAIKRTEYVVYENYSALEPVLPEELTFVHSEELAQMYPKLTPREREIEIVKQHKAVFVIGIGGELSTGEIHDGRAPDYDDWSTPAEDGRPGLNGDIVLWNPLLKCAFEVSSMGIRVDPEALRRQLKIRGMVEREKLMFHRRLLDGKLPLSIGGGIGQSRLCMFLLQKAHVGEVQASVWPEEMVRECRKHKIVFM